MNKLSFSYYQFKAAWRTLTLRRLANYLRLIISYFFSRMVRKPFIKGYPYAISMEPAGYCTLKCPECPTGVALLTRAKGTMNMALFQQIIDGFSSHLMHINLFFQGEPFLNRSLGEMISYASSKNIYTLISTNGQLLNQQSVYDLISGRLTEIIFSVDGLTQQTYELYRVGGRLSKLIAVVELLVDAKRRTHSVYPLITLQFIVFEHNQHEVGLLDGFAKRLGADRYVVKTAQFNDFGTGTVKPPTNKRWRRYRTEKQFQPTVFRHCWRQWSSCVIGWDGTLVPCCYDKNGDHTFGNISQQPLDEIWNNGTANDFRLTVLNSKYSMAICRNCPEGRGLM